MFRMSSAPLDLGVRTHTNDHEAARNELVAILEAKNYVETEAVSDALYYGYS